jgi:apolipoprotein N-acyltransferase
MIDAPGVASFASILGAPGVSLLVAIANGCLAGAIGTRGSAKERLEILAPVTFPALAAVLAALWVTGSVPSQMTRLRVASIQTNVPMNNKVGWTPRQMLEDWRRFITLTRHAATPPEGPAPDLIVWPETMHPTSGLDAESDATQRKLGLVLPYVDEAGRRRELASTFFTDALLALQQETNIPMLVGAIAYEGFNLKERPDGGVVPDYRHRYNSMFMVREGRVEAERYDKLRLTPFGEEMPGVRHIPGLAQALQDFAARGLRTDLSAGTRATVFRVKARESGHEFRIVTPICYETTVSEVCRRLAYGPEGRRADIIVNPSNDGWFAWSDAGRETHLNLARWRAVELGTPIIRAVNTGISALIDTQGRVRARAIDPGGLTPDPDASGPEVMADFARALERGARVDGVLAADVPMARRSTLFGTTFGPAVPWGMLVLAAGALALAAWKGRRTQEGRS